MAGRSSRRFGQSIARAYAISAMANDMHTGGEQFLKRVRAQASNHDGGIIVSRFYIKFPQLKVQSVRLQIALFFPNANSWKVQAKSFQDSEKISTIVGNMKFTPTSATF
jgi:hypothetical protein